MAAHSRTPWWQRPAVFVGGGLAVASGLVGVLVASSGGDSDETVAIGSPTETPVETPAVDEPAEPVEPAQGPLTSTVFDIGDMLTATLTDLEDRLPPLSTGQLGPGWEQIDAAPIETRTAAAAVWTGAEVVLWGGQSDTVQEDGAAYNPSSGTWRVISASPLEARTDTVAVWTGAEMIVVGGHDADRRPLFDGAAYNPALDSWRLIDIGVGATQFSTTAVWVGDQVLLVGVVPQPGSSLETDTIAYQPDTAEVVAVPPSPLPGINVGRRAFMTESGVLLAQTDQLSDAVQVDRFDLDEQTWVSEAVLPLRALHIGIDSVAWTGTQLVVVAHTTDGVSYDPATGSVTEISGSRSSTRWPAVMVDDHVFLGDIRFDPTERQWLADVAYPQPDSEFPTVVATDNGAFVWGGSGCGRAADCVGFSGVDTGLLWTEPFAGASTMLPPLDCGSGSATITEYEVSVRFADMDDALDDWWENGEGSSRTDRAELEQGFSSRFVTYADSGGIGSVILLLGLEGGGWHVIASTSCEN